MASSYVRALVKSWMGLGNVPFYNTENEEQDPADQIWSTIEWSVGQRDSIDFCEHKLEVGEFNIVILGPLGNGDDSLIAIAEQEADLLMSRLDPSGLLQLMSRGVPDPFPIYKNLFCVSVPITYEYQS